MDMENSIAYILKDKWNEVEQRKSENKGREYKKLYLRISFATYRDRRVSEVGPTAYVVYECLMTHSNKESKAYPSLLTIGKEIGVCVDSVRRAVAILHEKKWINISGRKKVGGGRYGNNVYQLQQKDLVRCSNDPNFIDQPVGKNLTGTQAQPISNYQYGNKPHKDY